MNAPEFLTTSSGMRRFLAIVMGAVVALVCWTRMAVADPTDGPSALSLLAPPKDARPRGSSPLRAERHQCDRRGAETFELAGVLTLTWHDPRQAFDPAVVGVDEKIFQGAYQFNELSTGWYPQVVLVNESGLYQKSGVVLRLRPDGTATLIETLNAAAEPKLDMSRFPLTGIAWKPSSRSWARRDEVLAGAIGAARSEASELPVPQWTVTESVRRSGIALHPTRRTGCRQRSS